MWRAIIALYFTSSHLSNHSFYLIVGCADLERIPSHGIIADNHGKKKSPNQVNTKRTWDYSVAQKHQKMVLGFLHVDIEMHSTEKVSILEEQKSSTA